MAKHIITPEVIELLTLLARYKYLRTSFIYGLLPHRSERGLRATLKRCRENGYTTLPEEQRRGYNSFYCPHVHMLSMKGEELLLERGISPKAVTRLYRHETGAPVRNFAHAMMICDTLASIEIGCLALELGFIPWTDIVARSTHENPLKLPFDIRHDGERLSSFAIPDGLFGIRYQDGKVAFFALEAEHFSPLSRTTLKGTSTLKKVLAYREISAKQGYKQQLNIPNLRILFVMPSGEDVANAQQKLTKHIPQSNLCLFAPVPVQERLLKAPPPFPDLVSSPLYRLGLPPITLAERS